MEDLVMKKVKSARDLTGILIRTIDSHGQLSKFMIRVYSDKEPFFKDYDIEHFDLTISITDEDAYLYEDDVTHENYIDYSPGTLGLTLDLD